MAQGGPIPGPAVRNTPPDANDFGLVVRVVGGGGGPGVLVTQGTVPWVVSDPPVEAALDVMLSTRASEATLLALNALVAAGLDVPLSTRASEATLTGIAADTANLDVALSTRASEATVSAIAADTSNLDVALSTRASEATLATRASEATLSTRASEATLATRASEATLAARLADATFTARVNTLGQKLMAASTPVVIASDQSAIPVSGVVSVTDPAEGNTGAAVPAQAIQAGGSDGTNLQALRLFDADTGGGTQFVQGVSLRKSAMGGSVEAGTPTDPLRIDPTGTTTQPISAAALPLPAGAATEATLATRLADATFTARINTLGQKTMANSTPVVLASDQASIPVTGPLTDVQLRATAVPVSTTQLPAALVGGRLDENVGAWLGSTAPTVGQKTMANSVPVVISSDQSAVATSGGPTSTGTLANGAETAVGVAAVQILAANANRKAAIIQNTGVANIRIGVAGVGATTGMRLTPGSSIVFEMPYVPTQAIFAIRETVDSTALAQEIT